MELRLSPETEARLNELAILRGCKPEQVVESLVASCDTQSSESRAVLDRRYDEMVNGTVKMLSPEEFWDGFETRKAEWLAKKGQ